MSDRPPERAELDAFLDPLLGFAHDMLRKHGEFYPFGATISSDGEMGWIAAETGNEHPPSQELVDLLVGGMRTQAAAGTIRAAAICYDARFTPEGGSQTDAIAIHLEHEAGDAALVMQPHAKGRFTGLKFGQLVAVPPPERRIFISEQSMGA